MSYDLENEDEVARFPWAGCDQVVEYRNAGEPDTCEINDLHVTDLHINGVNMVALERSTELLHKKLDIIDSKLDLLMKMLTSEDAIVCTKDESGNLSCHINLPNTHEEDEPLGI